jgi:hypothetical protein
MRKEKKKREKPYLWPGGLEARSSRTEPACSPSFRLGYRAEQPTFLRSSVVVAWAGLGCRSRARAPLSRVADVWTPTVSRVFLLPVVTEPETSSSPTESTRVIRDFHP